MSEQIKSAFTIDVEDGVSIAMRDVFSVKSPQTNRVVHLTEKILGLLSEKNTRATFFVLGVVAEEFPGLVRKIHSEGHEIGVHGYNHLQFFRMTKDEAFQELDSAKKLIEDISGQAVFGHRAPAFSISPDTAWGLDVIAKAGFEYDSSIMPADGKRYGWPGFPDDICRVETSSGNQIIEVPMSTVKLLGKKIPVCGGGYLRLFPEWFTRKSFEKISDERPAIVYIHPYELDIERYPDYYFEQLNKAGILKRNKMKSAWVYRKTVYPKLSALLENYSFDKMINLVRESNRDQKLVKL